MLKQAVSKIIASFSEMGKISKLILKITFIIFSLLAVPAIIAITIFINTIPNPDFLFICKSMIKTGSEVLVIGVIGGIIINYVFKK